MMIEVHQMTHGKLVLRTLIISCSRCPRKVGSNHGCQRCLSGEASFPDIGYVDSLCCANLSGIINGIDFFAAVMEHIK